jgi:hypothetical protein
MLVEAPVFFLAVELPVTITFSRVELAELKPKSRRVFSPER